MSHVVALSFLVSMGGFHCIAAEDVAHLQGLLAEDAECDTSSNSTAQQCSLNALQSRALSRRVDLDSEEGADLIEASRNRYAELSEAAHNRTEGMLGARSGIWPPRTAFQYNGMSWPAINIAAPANQEMHFFAIGDWGGMDGALQPPDGFPRMITYDGGHLPGPHVFVKGRLLCSGAKLTNCFFHGKKWCPSVCGFAKGVDDRAQLLVAEQLKRRAAWHDPKFILNVGDNFYWGGIAKRCGHPMNQIHPATRHQFDTIFEGVYRGPGLDGKPWLSVLGNHDWGGRMFTAGWDQQIAYTWASNRWLMPAAYWHQRVNFPGFSADIYMVDTNHLDALPGNKEKSHNICAPSFNEAGASCASSGGPANVEACSGWFQEHWQKQKEWLPWKMSQSDATWQIAVTHFPCDEEPAFWRSLHERNGLDLLVTGHRHDQELWKAGSGSLGGLTCFVTGGGGGITSEESILPWTPTHAWRHVSAQYGFFDMTITRENMKVESIDYTGKVVDTAVVYPK